MTDQEFRDKVIASLSRIETRQGEICTDMKDMRLTLYGAEGRTGLVEDVSKLKERQAWWNRGMVIAQGLLAAGLAALGLSQKGP